jgi:hypothetical protein
MLACIACSTKEGGEDGSRGAAATPHGGKSLTSQVNQPVHQYLLSRSLPRAELRFLACPLGSAV